METLEKISIKDELLKGRELINQTKQFLNLSGEEYNLEEWLTIKRYCERFNIEDTHVITNWIRRGIISPENVKEVEELNGLRLIKAIPYK